MPIMGLTQVLGGAADKHLCRPQTGCQQSELGLAVTLNAQDVVLLSWLLCHMV